jgi:hypothetical protein
MLRTEPILTVMWLLFGIKKVLKFLQKAFFMVLLTYSLDFAKSLLKSKILQINDI